jgi:hypothetical protein
MDAESQPKHLHASIIQSNKYKIPNVKGLYPSSKASTREFNV